MATAEGKSHKIERFLDNHPPIFLVFDVHCIVQDDEEDDLEEIPPGSPPRQPGTFLPDQFSSCSSTSELSTPLNSSTKHNLRLRNSNTIRKLSRF